MNLTEHTNTHQAQMQSQPDTRQTLNASQSGELDIESKNQPTARDRRFGFNIGKLHFLVPQGLFCELLVNIEVSPLPNSPSHVEGLINLRGNIVPMYSLATLLEQEKSTKQYAYLIGPADDGAALWIDKKPELIDLSEVNKSEANKAEIPEFLHSCISTSFKTKDLQWYSLDHEKLFVKLSSSR